MKKFIQILASFALVLSFFLYLPASGEVMAKTYKLSDSDGCYSVKGFLQQYPHVSGLAGTISGDIEGTVLTVGGPIEVHGIVIFRDVVQYWEITGGIAPELIGRTLVFENNFRGIINDYPMLKVNTTGTLIEGASKGNITLHGWTRMVDPVENYLDYHGVICP
jgi:hypothetical protein